MQKNWYIVYTKPKYEKKVAALLAKRKIDSFCPFNSKLVNSSRRNKMLKEPLFNAYVFVHTTPADITQVLHVDGVINLVYWKGSPAIINEDEIETIKGFIADYRNIKILRTQVNVDDVARIIDGPSYSIDGKVVTVKNKMIKVNLPSLGYTLIAEMQTDNVMGREISFGNKELLLQ